MILNQMGNDDRELFDRIVKEVLYRLGESKKIYLIKDGRYPEAWLDEMSKAHAVEWREELSSEDFEGLKEASTGELWLPELSISQMMSVIGGIPTDRVSKILFEAMLEGISVNVFESTLEISARSVVRTPFTETFFKGLELLRQSGLVIVNADIKINATKAVKNIVESKHTIEFKKRVLTESQLSAFKDQGIHEVITSKDTILTPSAMDFIRINSINIDRK